MRSSHVLTAVLALTMLPAVAAGAPTIAEVSSGLTANSPPTGITAGPDGNLWFTQQANPARIGRITPAGVVTEFTAGLSANSQPTGIAAGPDGNLWFTERLNPARIGRITPAGVVTEFTVRPLREQPADRDRRRPRRQPVVHRAGEPGPDRPHHPRGVVTEFTRRPHREQPADRDRRRPRRQPVVHRAGGTRAGSAASPPPGWSPSSRPACPRTAKPTGIAAGPDGNLWFTEQGNSGAIGRITPAGVITEFTEGLSVNSKPTGIAAGPDGNIWFTQQANPGRIGRITPAGVITEFTEGLSADSKPTGIAAGPDGNLWFTEQANPGRIGRISFGSSSAPGGTDPFVSDPPSLTAPRPEPALGRKVATAPLAGVVRIKAPGSGGFIRLDGSTAIPTGSAIDARRGRVSVVSALPGGRTQTATFWGGAFIVRQNRSGMTKLVLPRASGCTPSPATAKTSNSRFSENAKRRRKKGKRRPSLWGSDRRGRYQTQGSNSVATVRGTKWQTVNRCDGTLTRVREGVVVVRDKRLRRNVKVTAGRGYLARARR